jgi:hypothetical protein
VSADAAGAVTALRFSRDGALLASGSADTTLVVWDVVAEAGLCRFKGHKDAITDLVSSTAAHRGGAPSVLSFGPNKHTAVKTSYILCVTVVWVDVAEAGLCRFKGHKDAVTDLVSSTAWDGREPGGVLVLWSQPYSWKNTVSFRQSGNT